VTVRGWMQWAAATAAALAVLAAPASAGAAVTPPSQDPFYSYSGPLSGLAPGTVLRTRSVQISASSLPVPLSATQVLYRTQNQLGQPSATVATIIKPAAPIPVKLLSYQTFYDGLASTCRPSYTLRGGGQGGATAGADEALILSYVDHGFTVVTSDYEGPTDDFGAGRESAYGTLDAIRAAEHELGLPAGTPVGLLGYSGGSIASEWASELQSSYAPELHIIGVAAGGVPVDYAHNLAYIDGSSGWAGAIPAILLGVSRAYHLDLSRYLTPQGMQIENQVAQGCLNPSAYPGLTFESMLQPRYRNWKQVRSLVDLFNVAIMGTAGRPQEPMFLGVGNADGTGDGVMVAADVRELAYEYCQRGVTVQFSVYNGLNHDEAAAPFESAAQAFLQQVYAGQTPASGCASITPGNSLAPLPEPPSARRPSHHRAAPRVVLRSLSVSRARHAIVVRLHMSRGRARHVVVELRRGGRVLARVVLARLGTRLVAVLLRVHGRMPADGRYTVAVLVGRTLELRRVVIVR
jgi:hypothetical protein